MGYLFEWDPKKAEINLRKHGVSFDEATTVFADPMSILQPDPSHSVSEHRTLYWAFPPGVASWWWHSPSGLLAPASSPRGGRLEMSGGHMKRKVSSSRSSNRVSDRDTMQPEYDFSKGVRGVTAARYAEGANVVMIDPEVLDVFPDGRSVNEALRALAPIVRQRRTRKRRSAQQPVPAGGAPRPR